MMATSSPSVRAGPWIRKDILASFVVFLVALPLSMGIAIASGTPVAAGLITGIVGGLIAGILAGCPLQVSGPAAGLTVVVYGIVAEYGLPALGWTVLVAGCAQLLAALAGIGQWFRAVTPAVVKGMLSGIGVLIVASQFHVMVDDRPAGSGIQNLLSIPSAVAKGLPLPEWGSAASRHAVATLLKDLGRLHELQGEIREAIDERVPSHLEATGSIADGDWLAPLAARQAALCQQLASLVAPLLTLEDDGHSSKSKELATDAARVLALCDKALVDLRTGHVETARASQREAELALETLLLDLESDDWAAKFGLATILILVGWQMFLARRLPWLPGPLVAVVVAAVAAGLLSAPVLYVEVPEQLWTAIHRPQTTIFVDVPWPRILSCGLVIAVVASAETLLCATAVDRMHSGPRTGYNRELFSQGVGNIICGLLGSLPMTGVIVRSAANVQAGATSRLSTILHGTWILLFVSLFSNLLATIPTSSLAGILVYTGYKLIRLSTVRELMPFGKGEVFIYLVTVVVIVVEDLLIGVVLGTVLSALRLLIRFTRLRVHVEPGENGTTIARLEGAATFLRIPLLAKRLDQIEPGTTVDVDISRLNFIDHGCLEHLLEWASQHQARGGEVRIDWRELTRRFGHKELPILGAKPGDH